MEKDIEILEKFIKIKINSYAMQFVDIPYPRLQEAIENLINRVKELQEENNKLKEQIVYLTSTNNKDIFKYWRKK